MHDQRSTASSIDIFFVFNEVLGSGKTAAAVLLVSSAIIASAAELQNKQAKLRCRTAAIGDGDSAVN